MSHISYHIAVSSSGKGRKFRFSNIYHFDPNTNSALGLQYSGTQRDKQAHRPDSGQDAFFVASVGSASCANATAFGIADGVGGWASQGVDPADFSHGLCEHMARAASSWSSTSRLNPRTLIEIGYHSTLSDPEISAGGSTACVGVAGADGKMAIANLGDSGFLQLRLGAVHHYSNPQTHAFNTPYQLSITPPHILAQSAIFGGAPLADLPEKAELQEHMLMHGDVLILATDGVWDNLNSQEVLGIVSAQMRRLGAWERTAQQGFLVSDRIAELVRPRNSPANTGNTGNTSGNGNGGATQHNLQGAVAIAVAAEAKTQSMNHARDGPFAKEVQRAYPGESFHGGKVDDICVLVVVPVELGKLGKVPDGLRAKL